MNYVLIIVLIIGSLFANYFISKKLSAMVPVGEKSRGKSGARTMVLAVCTVLCLGLGVFIGITIAGWFPSNPEEHNEIFPTLGFLLLHAGLTAYKSPWLFEEEVIITRH